MAQMENATAEDDRRSFVPANREFHFASTEPPARTA